MTGLTVSARRRVFAAGVAAIAAMGTLAGVSRADVISLSTTYNDWAGTVPATATSAGGTSGWGGWGGYTDPAAGGTGTTHTVRSSNNDVVTYSQAFSTDSSTANGLVNYEETNAGGSPLGTSYAGSTSPSGSVTINHTNTGFGSLVSSQLAGGAATATAVNAQFISALASHSGGYISYDITTPLGGDALSTVSGSYFIAGVKIDASDNNFDTDNFAAQEAVQNKYSPTSTDPGNYGDEVGAFEFDHGSYYTVVFPYTYTLSGNASDYEYSSDNGVAGSVKLELDYNSGGGTPDPYLGSFSIDNLRLYSNMADVLAANTPEPASLGLLALAAPALMRRRRS